MQNFELLRNVTIGQYIPTGSAVHRLDPRAKILATAFLVLAVSFNTSIIANGLFLALTLAIALAARISLRYLLRGLIMALPVLVFIFFMQALFLGWNEPAGAIYVQWGWVRITRNSTHLMVISLLRIISFIFLTSLVTMTSTTTELTHGVELLLEPFRRFGVPSHELALMFTIALRFVPTLAEELERIMKAQASRGGEFGAVRIWRPDRLARSYLPLIVPLFLSAFRRAEELVLAMEARCYVSGAARTRFVVLTARPVDHAVVATSFAIMLVMIFLPFPSLRDVLAPFGVTGL
jgi:energy-coupling factor transport system permease protein